MVRVPTQINPSTGPTAIVRQNLRAPSVDTSQIDRGISSLQQAAAQFEQNQLKRQTFDLNKRFMEEANARQQDYQQRMLDADPGAPNFRERVFTDYTARDQALVEEYRKQEYDSDALAEFQLRLGSMTGNYAGQAFNFQVNEVGKKAEADADSHATSISQYTTANPDTYASGISEYQHSLDLLQGSLPASSIQALKDRGEKVIREGAGRGLALQRPRDVVQALAPQLLQPSLPSAQEGPFDLSSYLPKLSSAESGGSATARNPNSSAGGLYQFTDGTWLGTYTKVYGNTGESRDAILAKKTDVVQQEKLITRLTTDNANALVEAGLPVTNSSVYLAHFLGSSDAIKLLKAGEDTPIAGLISPASIKANPSVLGGNKTVKDVVLWAFGKVGGQDIGAAPAVVEPTAETVTAKAVTGIPVLDAMDGPERLQVLSLARQEINRTDADLKAAVNVKVENAVTAYETTGAYAGQLPTDAELIAAGGPVWAEQTRGRLQAAQAAGSFVVGIKTQSPEQMQAGLEALRPKDSASPTFAKDQTAYEAAQRAVAANMQARQQDPANYVFSAYPAIADKLRSGDVKGGYAAMAEAYKQLNIPAAERFPMPKEMIRQAAQSYVNQNADQRLNTLNQWFTQLPREMISPFVHQMVEGSPNIGPSLGNDAFLYATLQGHPEFRSTMLDAMAGAEIQSADSARRITSDVADKAFRRAMGGNITVNAAASENYKRAATALYVANGGTIPSGPNPQLDPALFAESLRRAVGGLKNDKNTGIVDYNGAKLILPPAVTKQRFESWVTSRTLQDLVNNSLERTVPQDAFGHPPHMKDIIDEGQFVMQAPGLYAIRYGDGGYLVTRTGHKFVVRVKP